MEQTWVSVALAALNVVQTLALAYMADRSRRVRHHASQAAKRRRKTNRRPPNKRAAGGDV